MNRCIRFLIVVIIGISCFIGCDKPELDIVQQDQITVNVSDLLKTWVGEYEGWDSLMNAKFQIFRQLTLNPNGTYTNVLGAVIDLPNASKEPAPIEKEAGVYEILYNDSTNFVMLNYIVSYDSIVDFGTQTFIGYDHKHYYTSDGEEHSDSVYQQTFKIIRGEKGTFQLEATDSLMFSLDGKGNPIVYLLKVENNKN